MRKLRKLLSVLMLVTMLFTMFSGMAVNAAGTVSMATTSYKPGESISVSYAGTSASDWIGIYHKGATPSGTNPSLAWKYTKSIVQPDGTMTFAASDFSTPLAPGDYEAILCLNDGYDVIGRVGFTIVAVPEISISAAAYDLDFNITVNYANTTSQSDWIGIYKKDAVPSSSNPCYAYKYCLPVGSGSVTFTPQDVADYQYAPESTLAAGDYEMILMANDGYDVLDRVSFKLNAPPPVDAGIPETFYVSTAGNDTTGDGSADAPFATLAKAAAALGRGDTLYIEAGEYNEYFKLENLTGTADAPINVIGAGAVKFNGAYNDSYTGKDCTGNVKNCQYVNVSNINFHFVSASSTEAQTLLVVGCKNVKISGCLFDYASNEARAPYAQIRVQGNDNCTFDANTITGGGSAACYLWGNISNISFLNNVITTYYGLAFQGVSDCKIINNVFAMSGGPTFYGGSYKNNIIVNNIFTGDVGNTFDNTNICEYNAYTNAGEVISASSTNVVADLTAIFVGGGDYSLKAGSPCIAAGSSASYVPDHDKAGHPRRIPSDIGAYNYGATYYVSATGADTNNGLSEAAPFKTFAAAVAAMKANPGSSLLVAAGFYTEQLVLDGIGTADSIPVVVRAYGGRVSLTGSEALVISNSYKIDVSGFDVSATSTSQYASRLANANSCSIHDCTFANGNAGMKVESNTTNCSIYNNTFTNGGGYDIYMQASANNKYYNNIFEGYYGILNEAAVSNSIITNNVFANSNSGYGIALSGASTGNVIQNNIFKTPVSVAAGNTYDYNLYDSSMLTAVPSGEGTHSVLGDPSFEGDSYRTGINSDCRNTGTDTNAPALDRDGKTRDGITDIGAYEYQSSGETFLITGKTPQGSNIPVSKDATKVQINFSETLKAGLNLADYITVTKTSDGSAVAGTLTVEDLPTGGSTVTFTADNDFAYSTSYTVTVKQNITNTLDKTLNSAGDVSWSFTTAVYVMDTYYIAENGDDSNLGTIDSPKKTVGSIKSVLKAGDTVIWRAGTYDEYIVLQKNMNPGDAPITFKAYDGEKVTLTASSGSSVYATIYALGENINVKFTGLTFAPTADQDYKGNALRFYNYGNSKISVSNCTFYRCDPAISVIDELDKKYAAIEIYNNTIISDGAGTGLYFREARVTDGSYGKIYNNVVYHAKWSLNMWGRSKNLLFYNNTFADVYDTDGGRGWFDIYPVQGTYNSSTSPINISENCVFKNNIFTKPIRTQLEGGKAIVDSTQNCVFDNNVYASNSMPSYVCFNYGGEGPVLSFSELQAYQDRGLEANGRYGKVSFVNPLNDARIIEADNTAIGAAADEIVPGVNAPEKDINGKTRTKEAGAFAYDPTLAFVGNYSGTGANGSLTKPYPSIQAAIAAGAKEIQIIAGDYSGDQVVNGKAAISAYDGTVNFNGKFDITSSETDYVSVKGVNLNGAVSVTGSYATINSCGIQGSVTLNNADGAVITNNIFAPKAADAIILSGSTNCTITNNVITERQSAIKLTASTANTIYNNTMYGNAADVSLSADSTGNIIKNNIFSAKISNRNGNTFDYNLYNSDTIAQADLDAITAGVEAHAVKAPADFINVKAKDYRIYKLSAAVGAGIMDDAAPAKDINGIARTNPPDIGAYTSVRIDVTYFVDGTNGNDANSGLESAPFKTIAAALDAVRNGENIIVLAGTYDEDINLSDRIGSDYNNYIIAAADGVVLNGSINIGDSTGVSIYGFKVNAGEGNTAVNIISSPNTVLLNLQIADTKKGVNVVSSPDFIAQGLVISNVENGIILDGANTASSATVLRTKVDNASVTAIEAKNKTVLYLGSSVITNSAKGVLGTGEASFYITNNTFYNNSGLSIDITQPDGHTTQLDILNNIFSRSQRGQGVFSRINKEWGFNTEYNLYDAGPDEAITYFYGGSQNFADTQTNWDETMSTLGDPMFEDAANGDFTLKKGSPAARAGTKTYQDVLEDKTEIDIYAPDADYAGTSFSALGQDIGAYYTPYSLKTINLAGDGAGLSVNNGGDGSAAKPFRYFSDAVNAMDSADTIIVHKGIYTGRYDIYNKHGVSDAHCIIKACDDPNCSICKAVDPDNTLKGPVFTGKSDWKNRDEEASHECMTKIVNSSCITIEGLDITGFRGAGIWAMDCDDITLQNLNIWDIDTPQEITSGVQGILVNGTTNSLFKDLRIWDVGQTRKSQADHGAYIGGCSNCVFDGLKVSNSPGGGIQFYAGDNYYIHSTDCVVKNCVLSESNMGLILCGIQGFLFTNNTFHNSWDMDLYMDWNVRDCLFQNNLFYNDLTTGRNDPTYGNYCEPIIINYQWNTLKTNSDNTTTEMIVNNTFRNNMFDYKHFAAECSYRGTVSPILAFMAAENASSKGNVYTNNFLGYANFKGTQNGVTDEYQKAQLIFDNMADIKGDSDCIDKGVVEYAPVVDILGRARDSKPDIGAYECPEADKAAPVVVTPPTTVTPTPTPTVTPTPTPGAEPQFSDIEGNWAMKAIMDMAKAGVLTGYSDGTARPNANATRAEFVTFIAKLMKAESNATVDFNDINTSAWYMKYLSAAVDKGWIKGRTDGSFAPNSSITREEAFAIISRIIDSLGVTSTADASVLASYTDKDSISAWAKNDMAKLVGLGIIQGSNGKLNPKAEITRAEICTILDRVMEKYLNK